jgi:hypothetical protein
MPSIQEKHTDPFDQELQQIAAAILETQASSDPQFIAAPWKRAQLIEELQSRQADVKRAQREALVAAAEAQIRDQRAKAWERLAPKRQALAERWEKAREELSALCKEAQRLQGEHVEKAGRACLSEAISAVTVARARLDVTERFLIVRPADLR